MALGPYTYKEKAYVCVRVMWSIHRTPIRTWTWIECIGVALFAYMFHRTAWSCHAALLLVVFLYSHNWTETQTKAVLFFHRFFLFDILECRLHRMKAEHLIMPAIQVHIWNCFYGRWMFCVSIICILLFYALETTLPLYLSFCSRACCE